MRGHRHLTVALVLLLLATGAAGAAQTQRTYTYRLGTIGTVQGDPAAFRAEVREILADPRGWSLGGSVHFREVSSGADLEVVLASSAAIGAAHPVCDPNFSCRVGNRVLLNDVNWRRATRAWREAGGSLADYRRYVLHHEMGHWWGFGHVGCPRAGALAPVMLQQSVSLRGCRPNGWPLEPERERLAAILGVEVQHGTFRDVPWAHPHREAIEAIAEAEVARGYPDGTFRPSASVTRAQMASFLTRALDLEPVANTTTFPDVPPEQDHAAAIAAIVEAGIAQGHPDGTFRPSEAVNRGQMASFLARAYGLEARGEAVLTDVPGGHTHAEAIAAVVEAGIAQGHSDGTFRPGTRLTRGQMASLLWRALQTGPAPAAASE
jgi:hypothetical protein